MPTRGELIAFGRTDEEICRAIGADALIYQDIDAMKHGVMDFNDKLEDLEASCFDGRYITGDITEKLLDSLESARLNSGTEATRRQLALNLSNDD
jgi:amidophosphoribosyltransferase